jgi:hypothetical protein
MWAARDDALRLLSGEMQEKGKCLDEMFALVDEFIDLFEQKANTDDFHRICGLTVLKAKNLAAGCYSLILDGLGQESGALMRPFIEYLELLTYYRLDPTRINEALGGTLPPAGKVAARIQGMFRDYRSHLNENASHSAYSFYALNHLLNKPSFTFRKYQHTIPAVLDKNVADLFALLFLLLIEVVQCLESAQPGCCFQLAQRADELRLKGISVFEFEARLAASPNPR